MSRSKRMLVAAVVLLAGLGIWLALDAEARQGVLDLWHEALALLGIGGHEEAGTWWCPMHPEIRRSTPGTCPI